MSLLGVSFFLGFVLAQKLSGTLGFWLTQKLSATLEFVCTTVRCGRRLASGDISYFGVILGRLLRQVHPAYFFLGFGQAVTRTLRCLGFVCPSTLLTLGLC